MYNLPRKLRNMRPSDGRRKYLNFIEWLWFSETLIHHNMGNFNCAYWGFLAPSLTQIWNRNQYTEGRELSSFFVWQPITSRHALSSPLKEYVRWDKVRPAPRSHFSRWETLDSRGKAPLLFPSPEFEHETETRTDQGRSQQEYNGPV